MGKTSKWIRNFLTGKKPRGPGVHTSYEDSSFSTEFPTTPIAVPPNTPKEKKRWSFRRSATTTKDFSSMDSIATTPRSMMKSMSGSQKELGKHSLVVETPAAEAPSSAIRRAADFHRRSSALHEAAATMIQAVFRSYLARKALCALKGLVKLQALVRGHLVRKQAITTLRCMQALVNVQTRTRAQRIQMVEEAQLHTQRSSNYRTALQESRFKQTQKTDRQLEDNIKVVEMDIGEPKGSASKRNSYLTNSHIGSAEQRSLQCHTDQKQDFHYQISSALSALTDMSPKARSRNLDEYSLSTERSSPHCYSTPVKQDPIKIPCSCPQPYVDSVSHDHTFFPNYMANTESFKAKARSQSAPKQRLDMFERQPSKKKASMEGRNALRPIRMQRSSSHVSSAAQGNQLSWSIKLDRSAVSLKGSECGSTSTVLTNPNYSRSLAAYEVGNY